MGLAACAPARPAPGHLYSQSLGPAVLPTCGQPGVLATMALRCMQLRLMKQTRPLACSTPSRSRWRSAVSGWPSCSGGPARLSAVPEAPGRPPAIPICIIIPAWAAASDACLALNDAASFEQAACTTSSPGASVIHPRHSLPHAYRRPMLHVNRRCALAVAGVVPIRHTASCLAAYMQF